MAVASFVKAAARVLSPGGRLLAQGPARVAGLVVPGLRDDAETAIAIARVLPSLAGHRTLLLTTFAAGGAPVRTPGWFAPAGDVLVVGTADEQKLDRLRRRPQVLVAPADATGRRLGPDESVEAEILDGDAAVAARRALAARYGVELRLMRAATVLGERRPRTYVALRPPA